MPCPTQSGKKTRQNTLIKKGKLGVSDGEGEIGMTTGKDFDGQMMGKGMQIGIILKYDIYSPVFSV
jgi:hypothetical protein